jgi:hypothetical protein
MPRRQQLVAMRFDVPDNITKLVSGISCIYGHGYIMEPEFGFLVA